MTAPVEKENGREITYHVGWKKGRIRHPEEPDGGRRALYWIWRPLPFLSSFPSRVHVLLTALLPAVGFAAVVWVVSMLARNRY